MNGSSARGRASTSQPRCRADSRPGRRRGRTRSTAAPRPGHGGDVHRLPVAVQDQRRTLEYLGDHVTTSHSSYHILFPRGVRGESNSHPLVHSQPCSNRYTTDTIYTVSPSTPTRSRTWNASLEARHDFRFTIGARNPAHQAEGKGVEPTSPVRGHGLANRLGKPYPTTFRNHTHFSGIRGARTLRPGQ